MGRRFISKLSLACLLASSRSWTKLAATRDWKFGRDHPQGSLQLKPCLSGVRNRAQAPVTCQAEGPQISQAAAAQREATASSCQPTPHLGNGGACHLGALCSNRRPRCWTWVGTPEGRGLLEASMKPSIVEICAQHVDFRIQLHVQVSALLPSVVNL